MSANALPLVEDFRHLFLRNTPMLDVRAPVEFNQGAFPHAVNLPLLDDAEREKVGLCYKQQGQEKAIELGNRLVSGETRERRIESWAAFYRDHPDAVLYCFRGGLRSKTSQQWLYEETGLRIPRVQGGYKAMRQYLLQVIDEAARTLRFTILSGRTGSGKTLLLPSIANSIDLEGLYNHRGSVFGPHVRPQPTQIDIENRLAIELLRFQDRGVTQLVLEDESASIGARRIPPVLHEAMRAAPVVVLQVDTVRRVENIFDEYVGAALAEHVAHYGEGQGFERWAAWLLAAIDKIHRRLGGKAHGEIRALMEQALAAHRARGETGGHRLWIQRLLSDYYDPMYDYQLDKKRDRVVFSGSREDVLAFLGGSAPPALTG